MLRSTTTKYTGLLDSRKRVCARSYETCRPFFLCFLVLSPAFADVVSVIRVWLHHVRIREPVVLAGRISQLHAWTDATKLARRSAWKKLQLQRLFCLFSILLYAKIVNPRYIFFCCVSGYTLREERDPFSIIISSGQVFSIQLCYRLVSEDIHVTNCSFLSLFLLFFSPLSSALMPSLASPSHATSAS